MMMAFCRNCGIQTEGEVKFCPACGASMGTASQPVASGGGSEQNDATENKIMAVLAYIIVLVPIFAARESKFARYHANQGLILLIAAIAYGIVFSILSTLLMLISWQLALIVTGVLGLVGWAFPALSIIGIIRACKGEMKPLPLIGGIRMLK